jgi:hypothetical protein
MLIQNGSFRSGMVSPIRCTARDADWLRKATPVHIFSTMHHPKSVVRRIKRSPDEGQLSPLPFKVSLWLFPGILKSACPGVAKQHQKSRHEG